MEAEDIAAKSWDALIVGTGVGGATLGFALARAGQRVLFCEKGKSRFHGGKPIVGSYPELSLPRPEAPGPQHREVLSRAGRHSDWVEDQSGMRPRSFIPFIGSGSGGSSALFGMAMERFFPADFAPRSCHPESADSSVPERWPISYAELEPYYQAAEDLYRVRGARDPLRGQEAHARLGAAPPLTPAAAELADFFQSKGLHPYRLPLACEFVPGCRCCQGYLCELNCKNDSARICLLPALSHHGAALLDECEVLRLEATSSEVTGAVFARRGKEMKLRARIVVLAAGALESPCILLRSASPVWPGGLGNASGLVGRNLMRHHVDLYLLAPRSAAASDLRQKEIAFNDFYHDAQGSKLGTVQSFGLLPPPSMLAAALEDEMRGTAAGPVLKLIRPLMTQVLRRMIAGRAVIATMAEDLPYADNLVRPITHAHGPRPAIRYRIRPSGSARIQRFRALMTEVLRPYRFTRIKQAENNRMLAHACGTCRFGADPDKSVLDANNRAHGLANLYVVDSSFLPSSGGTNPSLTIAANALRVAAHLAGEGAA